MTGELLLILLIIIGMCLGMKAFTWFIAFLLAFLNYDAKFDNSKRNAILRLSKTDKTFEKVSKILELERSK